MPRVLDEEERYELIAIIAKNYPDRVDARSLGVEDRDVLRATISYLEEKGYLTVHWLATLAAKDPVAVTATAEGYDYAERAGLLED